MKIEGTGWYAAPNWITTQGNALEGAYERLVMLYLYRRAGPDLGSWPSQPTIAKDLGIGRTTVQLTLKSLQRKGFVEIVERHDTRGRKTSNYYRLGVRSPDERGTLATRAGVRSPDEHEVLSTSEVLPNEVKRESTPAAALSSPSSPRRPRKSDLALQTAKQFISQDARDLARYAAEKHGWPQVPFKLRAEAQVAQQFLDVGIGAEVLRDVIDRQEKLSSLRWLADRMDLRGVEQIADDKQRDEKMRTLIDRIWGPNTIQNLPEDDR